MNHLRYLLIAIVFLAGLFCFTACQKEDTSEEVNCKNKIEDKHDQYEQFAKKYSADNNLVLDKYLGMTLISFKDVTFKCETSPQVPVVYEWEVHNRASNQKLVLGVGPIMPMYPVSNPPVMLTTGRYEFKKKMKIK